MPNQSLTPTADGAGGRLEAVGVVPPPLNVQSLRWIWPVMLLASASALAFAILLVDKIAKGKTLKLDTTLLLALRRPGHLDTPIGPAWLEQSATFRTAAQDTAAVAPGPFSDEISKCRNLQVWVGWVQQRPIKTERRLTPAMALCGAVRLAPQLPLGA